MGWIIHYKDGTSLAESQDLEWSSKEKVPKENVTSLQISNKGVVHTLVVPPVNFGVFQHKVGFAFWGPTPDIPLDSRQIGVVINKSGDCIILDINERTNQSRVYLDNAYDMKMNFDLHQIQLEKVNG